MLGIGKLLSAIIETAKLPLDVAEDVLTLGEGFDDTGCQTKRRVEKVQRKLEDMD